VGNDKTRCTDSGLQHSIPRLQGHKDVANWTRPRCGSTYLFDRSQIPMFHELLRLPYLAETHVSSSNGNQYSLAMPFVDLHSQDDFASIFYTTNTTFNNVSAFDPERPTIIVLHPLFLDSTWLDNQFGDPRLSGHYNVIAFDMRTCGRSRCRSSGRHDSWVDSADLAFCCQVSLCYPSVFFLTKFN
jgi:pimeloyl-ACP methyl ester carboxylesterase